MTKKNEIAPATKNELAPVIDYGTDAGDGFQDVGRDEIGIPFLKILQAQSPEVIGPQGKIDGAVAGMLLNTGTEELLENVTLVPALRQHVFVEWRPKKQGGGIVEIHEKNSPIVQAASAQMQANIAAGENSRKPAGGTWRFGEMYTEAGNDLVETFYLYCVVLEDDVPTGFLVMPFSSTQIKKYKKKFMNRAGNCVVKDSNGKPKRPPMYAHRIVIGTEIESNDDGTWFSYSLQFAVDNNVLSSVMNGEHMGYQAGKELKVLVDTGAAKADTDKAGDADTDGGTDADDSEF